ncbi:MAG: 5'/3'-nucleotidase SurE [Beijerinckiaceae bacterium]
MHILITNDDGSHAPGLAVLEAIARDIGDEVTIVAPESDQSGVAHSLTLNDPLRLREISPSHFAVKGTPTDCVIMAIHKILDGRKPDLVLSGVNRGHNVAEDVTYSGTIAGAMEGTILGIPSIALSQSYAPGGHNAVPFDCARTHAPDVIRRILKAGIAPNTLVNVNFPRCSAGEVEGVSVTRQGKRDTLLRVEERFDGRRNPYYWIGFQRLTGTPPAGSDLEALATNRISVTPLQVDMTAHELAGSLTKAFGG